MCVMPIFLLLLNLIVNANNRSGSKATLITRVTKDDKRLASEAFTAPSHPAAAQVKSRGVSASAPDRAEPSSLPSSSAGSSNAGYLLDVKIPEASKGQPETPIAIVRPISSSLTFI